MRNVVIASLVVTSIALIASSSEAKPKAAHHNEATSQSATPNESLDDKAKWAKQDVYMATSVTNANRDCGITDKSKMITYTWDKDSFKDVDWAKSSPNGMCSMVFDEIQYLCKNTDGASDAVQKGLKNVTCRYGGKGKFSTSMSKGNFTVVFDYDQPNMGDSILQSLKKNL